MPEIKESVGPGLKNRHHDVALIQAMLVVVKNAKGAPYLARYDGVYGGHTENAILAFQHDQVFKKQPAAAITPVPGAKTAPTPSPTTAINAKLGVINPNDATFNQLVSMLPADYKEINVLPGGSKTVYLSAADDDRKACRDDVLTDTDLDVAFRGKVAKLIDEVFNQHKIAMWVVPAKVGQDGRLRTFERQNQLSSSVTGAGPARAFIITVMQRILGSNSCDGSMATALSSRRKAICSRSLTSTKTMSGKKRFGSGRRCKA